MEVERKSLASFFGMEALEHQKDVCAGIAKNYFVDKQWWYIDKNLKHDKSNHFIFACFNKNDTEILTVGCQYYKNKELPYYTMYIWDSNNRIIEEKNGGIYLKMALAHNMQFRSTDDAIIDMGYAGDCIHIHHRPFSYKTQEKNTIFYRQHQIICVNKSATEVLTYQQWRKIFLESLVEAKAPVAITSSVHTFVSAQFNDKEDEIVTMTIDGILAVWNKNNKEKLLKYEHEFEGKAAFFNKAGDKLLAYGDDKIVYIHDRNMGKIINQLEHPENILCARFNPLRNEVCTLSEDGDIRIWDCNTGNIITQFFNGRSPSLEWNNQGTKIIGINFAELVWIWSRYDNYTFPQILLRKVLNTWLQVEKPDKEINSSERLLKIVSGAFCFDGLELETIWSSFPKNMQDAIWLSMKKKIQRYGK